MDDLKSLTLESIGQQYGRAWADHVDQQWAEWVDRMLNPDGYWKPSQTYSGIGAKRRLLMKVQRG